MRTWKCCSEEYEDCVVGTCPNDLEAFKANENWTIQARLDVLLFSAIFV